MKGAVLWKRILNNGCICDIVDGAETDFVQKVICAQIIVDSRTGPPDKTLHWEKYNHMAVPFDNCWIEGQIETGQVWGVLMVAQPRESDGSRLLACAGVISGGAGPCCLGLVTIKVDREGNLDSWNGNKISTYCRVSQHMLLQYPEETVRMSLVSTVGLGLDLLTLLGCKNVSLNPLENDQNSTRRAVKRHGGTPENYRYHTLVVRPPGAKHDSPGVDIGIMPRHVCRGHFAEYGPEFNKGLLFGKYAGRFYIPPHLKVEDSGSEINRRRDLITHHRLLRESP